MPFTLQKLVFGLILMSVIVGAASQPLQPAVENPGISPAWHLTPDIPVALLLPLSGPQQSAGTAVRDGFIAAHLSAARSPQQQLLVFDVALLGVDEAHAQARKAGAGLIVGPLLRESVQALNRIDSPIPVLALNYLPDGEVARAGFWQFGLAPEDEIRAIAARAASLGQLRAISLAPDNSWGRRLQAAFQDSITALGGQVVAARLYPPGESDFSPELRTALAYQEKSPGFAGGRRQDIDLVFLVATHATGKLIHPQLRFYGAGNLATYSTSAIWEDGDPDASDLNGISFPDGPWMIAPDGRSTLVKAQLARHFGPQSLTLSRLYALGYDARQLLPAIHGQAMAGPFRDGELQGVTGSLDADSTGRIYRRLSWATIRGGQAVPAPVPATGFQPVSSGP